MSRVGRRTLRFSGSSASRCVKIVKMIFLELKYNAPKVRGVSANETELQFYGDS